VKSLPLLLSLVLMGCSATAPSSRLASASAQVPVRWSATKEARAGIDTRWVSRIGGAKLSSLVDEALSANPDMQIAAERINQAISNAKIAGASLKPTVSAGLDGTRSKQIFVGFPFGDGGMRGEEMGAGGELPSFSNSSISNNFGANLTVAWEPDLWGGNRATQAAAIAEAQADGQLYRAARASLAAQVVRAWLAVAEANEQIVLQQSGQDLRKTTLSIVKDRFVNALTAEGGSVSELRLAEREVASGEAVLIQRQEERARAIRQLELLMARYPTGAIRAAQNLPPLPSRPPTGLPSALLLRRPDIIEAERRFAAAGSRVKVGKSAFFPTLRLTARGGVNSGELGRLVDSDFGVWSLGASLTQPIWNSGKIREEFKRLNSRDRQDLARLQGTVLKAFGEVEQALVTDRFLALRTAAVGKAATAGVEAALSAREDYSNGIGDALSLINAEATRINLASQLVSLKRLQLDNRVTLHLALGGDYRVGK